MPRFNITAPPRPNKRADMQQNDLMQQHLDQQQQSSMVDQLSKLSGIANQEEITPAHLAQMGAQTRATNAGAANQEFENQWAQPKAEAQNALQNAQAGYMQAHANEENRLHTGLYGAQDLTKYRIATNGRDLMADTPEEYHEALFEPGLVQAYQAHKAATEATRQAQIAADQSQQSAPKAPPHTLGGLVASAVKGVGNIPDSLQGLENHFQEFGANFWGPLLGVDPSHPAPPVNPKAVPNRAWPWQPLTTTDVTQPRK